MVRATKISSTQITYMCPICRVEHININNDDMTNRIAKTAIFTGCKIKYVSGVDIQIIESTLRIIPLMVGGKGVTTPYNVE